MARNQGPEILTESDSSAGSSSDDATSKNKPLKMSTQTIFNETLCGITVALALVPEAVAFALAAGLAPSVGLNSAWIIATLTAIFGGRPAMICGATGSLAVLVGGTVTEYGIEYLFYAVILMGIIEILLGLANVGNLVKLIPTPVMIGFCNGLALVIGLAQFNNFKDLTYVHAESGSTPSARRLGSFDAFTDGVPFISGQTALFAGLLTLISFLVCMFLPKLTTRVPSALCAIIIGTIFEWAVVRAGFGASTNVVGDVAALGGSFPRPIWFDSSFTLPPVNFDTFGKVLQLSITMAAVGLLESLMTLNLVDEITKTKGSPKRECIGQGVANIVCGAMGGMGGCAMIGQSMINVNSGARHRVSSTVAGLCLLLIVLVAYPLINQIPVSALVGVMFDVCYHTFEWRSLTLMLLAALPSSLREGFFSERISKQRIRRADALIILLVTVVTLFTNLAEGVAVGMLLAFLMFAYESSELISVVTKEVDGVKYYHVHGILFFGSTTQFLELFDEVNDPAEIRIVFESGYVADFSAIEALNKLGERYGMQTPRKTVTLQELKPRTTQILSQAATLLREEITLQFKQEEILPADREHFNVESYGTGMSRQASWASRREVEDAEETSDHAQVGV